MFVCKCSGIRWPLFSYLHHKSQSLVIIFCVLDTTLRILITWYKLEKIQNNERINIDNFSGNLHITHIQDVHNIAGPLVPYNDACPKRGLIHRDRDSSVIRPLLYLQATMAGYRLKIWSYRSLHFVIISVLA